MQTLLATLLLVGLAFVGALPASAQSATENRRLEGSHTYIRGPFRVELRLYHEPKEEVDLVVSLGGRRAIVTFLYPPWSLEGAVAEYDAHIKLVGDRLVVEAWSGGNCWRCEWVHVFADRDGRLHYVGQAQQYDDQYGFTDVYDVHQSLDCSQCSPRVRLILKEQLGVFAVDRDRTCSVIDASSANWQTDLRRQIEKAKRDDDIRPVFWLLLQYRLEASYCWLDNQFDQAFALAEPLLTDYQLTTIEELADEPVVHGLMPQWPPRFEADTAR